MVQINCPWCESDQDIELKELGDEFVCPDCAIRILLVEAASEPQLALAA
jgi:DNA-directed RNA polymerase subunit RPC12/RpoP